MDEPEQKPVGPQILIRGGTLVLPDRTLAADVLIADEQIQAIGHGFSLTAGMDVVDARGLLVLPGVIDAHTHIQLDTGIYRTPDTWLEGTRAAAWGGVTTVVDFATQFQGQSLSEAVAARRAEARQAVIDYAFHVMITDLPSGREEELAELAELGATSIKLYTTYRPNYYADDATLLRLLEAAGRYGLMTLVHCENDALVAAQIAALREVQATGWCNHGDSRPALAEQEAAARVLFLAAAVGAPVVIAHNSTARTAALVAAARARGQVAFNETAPQYLLLDNRVYEGSEPWRYILQPPLRDPEEKARLWEQIRAGAVDMLITDHCDYTRAQKLAADDFTTTPGGLPGLETLLPLAATYGQEQGLTWPALTRMLSLNPARIYNLWPRKGVIAPGADADLVLYDPLPERILTADELHMAAGYTPFEGVSVQGRIVSTLRRGAFLVREGQFVGDPGSGRYLSREPRFWD